MSTNIDIGPPVLVSTNIGECRQTSIIARHRTTMIGLMSTDIVFDLSNDDDGYRPISTKCRLVPTIVYICHVDSTWQAIIRVREAILLRHHSRRLPPPPPRVPPRSAMARATSPTWPHRAVVCSVQEGFPGGTRGQHTMPAPRGPNAPRHHGPRRRCIRHPPQLLALVCVCERASSGGWTHRAVAAAGRARTRPRLAVSVVRCFGAPEMASISFRGACFGSVRDFWGESEGGLFALRIRPLLRASDHGVAAAVIPPCCGECDRTGGFERSPPGPSGRLRGRDRMSKEAHACSTRPRRRRQTGEAAPSDVREVPGGLGRR